MEDFDGIRNEMIDKLMSGISKWFPQGSLKPFESLNAKLFPTNDLASQNHMINEVKILATWFGLPPEAVAGEYKRLLLQFATDQEYPFFKHRQTLSHEKFWTDLLNSRLFGLPTLFTLVKRVLAISSGSSDVERAFSILKLLHPDRRKRTKALVLDALLRIKLNADDDLANVDLPAFVDAWFKSNHLPTDSLVQIPQTFTTNLQKLSQAERQYLEDWQEFFGSADLLELQQETTKSTIYGRKA